MIKVKKKELTNTLKCCVKVLNPGFVDTRSCEGNIICIVEYIPNRTGIGHIVSLKHGRIQFCEVFIIILKMFQFTIYMKHDNLIQKNLKNNYD